MIKVYKRLLVPVGVLLILLVTVLTVSAEELTTKSKDYVEYNVNRMQMSAIQKIVEPYETNLIYYIAGGYEYSDYSNVIEMENSDGTYTSLEEMYRTYDLDLEESKEYVDKHYDASTKLPEDLTDEDMMYLDNPPTDLQYFSKSEIVIKYYMDAHNENLIQVVRADNPVGSKRATIIYDNNGSLIEYIGE